MTGLFAISLLSVFTAAAEDLSVVSWNIHKGRRLERVEREFAAPALKNADLLALQEVLTEPDKRQHERFEGDAHAAGRDVVLSRWTLLERGEVLVNPDTGRRAAWADARSPNGRELRIYSLHLSYKIGRNPFVPHVRAAEMRAVLDHAEDYPGPVIVAGDFNTVGWFVCCNRDAPLLRLLERRGYTDALAAAGVDCNTQHVVGTVDYIFVKGLEPRAATCGNYAGSDHKWIEARVAFK
jgi:endonuclease/exonuclease/phosphatase family metal-dependent hydrolase